MTHSPSTQPIACPSCGSSDLSFDWTGATTVRIAIGQLVRVTVGGVFGVLPDQLVCADCDTATACPEPLGAAVADLVEQSLPPLVHGAHPDGFTTHTADVADAGPHATFRRH